MQSSLNTATLEIRCDSCRETAAHEVTYASEPIHHLRCGACRAVNAYVVEEPEEAGKRRKFTKLNAVLQDHAALMQHRGCQELQAYCTTGSYTDGQYVDHTKFGEGYVLDILGPPMKMAVLFADKRRLLVGGPGSTSSAQRTKERKAQRGKPVRSAKPAKVSRRGRPKRSTEGRESEKSSSSGEPVKCPVCGHTVHPFNLLQTSKGQIAGCMYCH